MTTPALTPAAFRQLLADLGMTNAECTHVLSVTLKAVEDWRSGRRPVPGPVAVALELLQANRQLELALDLHIEKVKELAAGAGALQDLLATSSDVMKRWKDGQDLTPSLAKLSLCLKRLENIQ